MNKYSNAKELISAFIKGEKDGFAGSSPVLSNMRIKGDQLYHYQTPIIQRDGIRFIVNMTGYSPQTKRLQETVLDLTKELELVIVRGVPQDFKGRLIDFIR